MSPNSQIDENIAQFARPGRGTSNLVASVALVFSLGTTGVSYLNIRQEEIRENRREARGLIQRLTRLPIEQFEMSQREAGEAGAVLSAMLNQESILLATQCVELIRRYPSSFGSTEFFAVATALLNSNLPDEVPYLYQMAIAKANNANDYNVAKRAYGGFLYTIGDVETGRSLYQEAVDVWNVFPEVNAYRRSQFDAQTLIYWAQAEMGVGELELAKEKAAAAAAIVAMMPAGPLTDQYQSQVTYTEGLIQQWAPLP
ncbi:MAG: hypothetical protein AAF191_10895 [Verrucomicrobiota bacterium]